MRWSKNSAIARTDSDSALQHILCIEPRLRSVIDEAKRQRNVRGYNRVGKYLELRKRGACLVGWCAEKRELRTGHAYDTVIRAIDDLLPPDRVDLNPGW